jgi:uncharacterized lipoprotein YajG
MGAANRLGIVVLVILMAALSGCAFTPEKIDLAYAPTIGASKVPGAERVKVNVVVNDIRTDKRVGSKSNAYGAEMAAITSNQDVVVLVRDALTSELAARGYEVGDSNVELICSIFDFANKFRPGFWSGTAEASVRLQVKIRDDAGNTIYDETVIGQGTEEHIQVATGRNAKPALEKALQMAMRSLMDRQDFHAALLRTAPAATDAGAATAN